jgi:acyl-CoA thioesterase FadM
MSIPNGRAESASGSIEVEPSLELEPVIEHMVGPADTDHLGHMNIRRYAEIGEAAVPQILAMRGLDQAWLEREDAVAVALDCYTRHYREQRAGAVLTLVAGFLDADADAATVYAELRNPDRDELAATFVHRVGVQRRAARSSVVIPAAVVSAARAGIVAWPEHGRPRSLTLDPIRLATPSQLRDLALEAWGDHAIVESDCDRYGRFAGGVTTLAWGPERHADRASTLENEERSWLFADATGPSVGLANVESRRVYLAAPRAGARVKTVAANLVIGSNRRVRREWSYNPMTGQLYAAGDFVDLVFDTDTRRAVEIPPGFRAELERWYHPELA